MIDVDDKQTVSTFHLFPPNSRHTHTAAFVLRCFTLSDTRDGVIVEVMVGTAAVAGALITEVPALTQTIVAVAVNLAVLVVPVIVVQAHFYYKDTLVAGLVVAVKVTVIVSVLVLVYTQYPSIVSVAVVIVAVGDTCTGNSKINCSSSDSDILLSSAEQKLTLVPAIFKLGVVVVLVGDEDGDLTDPDERLLGLIRGRD